MTEVGVDIESKPVHAHPPAQMHSNSTNFSRRKVPGPYAGKFIDPASGHAKVFHRSDDNFLERPDITVNIGKKELQIENRIDHQLAGTVVGNVPSPIDSMKGNALLFQKSFIDQ